jgi:uncharacterized YccA/Bax inhibitor family protein
MFRNTSNLILASRNFAYATGDETATLQGTVNRCLILLALVFGSTLFSWSASATVQSAVRGKLLLFTILGLVTCVTTCIKKEWAGVTAPLYAVFEGLVLGLFSKFCELSYHGIVFQAISLTFGVAFGMIFLYKSGIIQISDRFRTIVGSAMFGICMFYLVSWILSFFGVAVPMINSSGVVGIGLSVFVVVIAALSLAIDFDFIVQVSDHGLQKYLSWFAAFGLMITLVWLYLEILRLLVKIRER